MANKDFLKKDLDDLICKVTGLESVTSTINNQIKRFCLEDGMTWLDIARTIVWYTQVDKQTINLRYGIAFVPNVFPMAAEYFRKLKLEQQRQEKEAEKVVRFQGNNIIFKISSLKHKKRKPKQLDISEIDVRGD